MSASFVESGPAYLLEELVGRTYAALHREVTEALSLSGTRSVCVCVLKGLSRVSVGCGGFLG